MSVLSSDEIEFGFDATGRDWTSYAQERAMLRGHRLLDLALYFVCLMPFANKAGDVELASYYRFIQMLTPRQSRKGGPRVDDAPTKRMLRDALLRLQTSGLCKLYLDESRNEGVLKIRMIRRFGVVSSDSVRAGVRAGGVNRKKRRNMPPAA